MAWFYVFFAAFVEVFWVIGLKYSDSFLEWSATVVLILFSFLFVIKACEKIPSGTVYAVFTGLGAAAIISVDFIVFDADFSLAKLMFLLLIIVGVIGIKMTTSQQKNKKNFFSHKTAESGGK